jgi:hypothetical protein
LPALPLADPRVAPPLPAPYLADAPQLPSPLSYSTAISIPDDELDQMPRLRLEMQQRVREAKIAIRRKRQDYEREHGVVIVPEPVIAD